MKMKGAKERIVMSDVRAVRGRMPNDFREGDWIMADHPEYDLLRGYIVRVDGYANRYLTYITDAAEERFKKAVGREIWIELSDIQDKLDEEGVFYEEPYILNMIDVALSVYDEELFFEMTEKLNFLREAKKSGANQVA